MTELVNLNFKIVVPAAATNLVTNPSFETNTTGYTAVGGATLTRSATHQRRGAWALRITPVASTESGTYFGTVSVTSGVAYVFSVDVLGVLGQDYKLQLQNTTPTERAQLAFTGTGYWQRLEVAFTATATESWRLYVVRDSGETGTDYFYIDGLQFETGDEATTYFDGDSIGFVIDQKDFGWNGARHGSTSYRTAKTRAGGSLLNISDYATLAGVYGLGMGSFAQHYTNIITGGAVYEGHSRTPRTISLLLHYTGSMSEMWDDKNAIINAIRPDYTGDDQPLILRFQGTDASGNDATEPIDIVCIPEMSHTDFPQTPALQEDVLIFKVLDSYLLAAYQEGVQLDFADSLTNANYILMRDSDAWKELATGLNGTVRCFAIAPNGDLYIGGSFTDAGGDTDADYLCKWDGTSFSAVVAGISSVVYALAFDSEGNLYIGGNFQNLGDANGDYIVMWDGSSLSSLGTGMNGFVRTISIDSQNNVYAGGKFSTAGGTIVNHIAKWNGTTWSAMGSGADGTIGVYTSAIDKNDNLYIGGGFTTVNGVTVNGIAKWNGSTWSDLDNGLETVTHAYSIAFAPNGDLYVGGDFDETQSGLVVNHIAKWNGTSWESLGTGSNESVHKIYVSENGIVYVSGRFSVMGDITTIDRIAMWENGAWKSLDVDLPGTPYVYDLLVDSSNILYVGYSTSGTATVAGNVTATNGGGANCYPKVRINGPGTLHKLINNTTGAQVGFANLTLLTGEILTINFEPGNISAESTYRGNCLSYIAPGSDLADFYLRKGANSISFLMTGTDGDTAATMFWTPSYWSLDQTKHGA